MKINGYAKKTKKVLKDKIGYFKRAVALKRLEKYSNEIDMVLTKYNKKSCDETMMVKGLRKSCAETTNRKIHQEDLEKIVAQIAKGLGLNEKIVKIMGKHHDIGHTFLGHSGEWWISNILEDYGLGYFCHNTIGARELVYTNDIYNEIIEKIKVHNPKVNNKVLDKIKSSLWLIIDGINAHNGEKPEKQFIPDIHKSEEDFIKEMLFCYTKKGYDRIITPATSEACLMRLADQISYIPLDMVDGLREKMIRDENGNIVSYLDDDYRDILIKLGIRDEEINECNKKGNYLKIAERLKEIFIEDVKKNSNKQKISMSKDIMQLMNELRNLNNAKIVDYVVLTEDQSTYPKAIRTLMNRYKKVILQHKLVTKFINNNINMQELSIYTNTPDEDFINYICNTSKKDFYFTLQIVEQASKQAIGDELDIARTCVETRTQYEDKEELGLQYGLKNARIKEYIKYYEKLLRQEKLVGYNEETRLLEIDRIWKNIQSGKQNTNYIDMEERIALLIAAKYVASLNDHEFIQLLQDTEIIDEKQYKSLTRKYKDIPNLKEESYTSSNWKAIKTVQIEATNGNKGEQK